MEAPSDTAVRYCSPSGKALKQLVTRLKEEKNKNKAIAGDGDSRSFRTKVFNKKVGKK